jgi:putative addiction module component (TIGR02574 family)
VSSAAKKVLADALTLPREARIALVRELSDSLAHETAALGEDWRAEVASRLESLERDEVVLVSWESMEERLRRHTDPR